MPRTAAPDPATSPAAALTPPSRTARRAAYASALSATVGFIPLHLVWGLGIPLWADSAKFDDWYTEGGGPYLLLLNALAALGGILALSLVRPWGTVFPSWVPLLHGHRVPPRTLSTTAYTVGASLLAYTAFAAYRTIVEWNDPGIFSRWITVYGIPHFLVWGIGLLIAARAYHRRTAGVGHGG